MVSASLASQAPRSRRRLFLFAAAAFAAVTVTTAQPAAADVVFGVNTGYFALRGEDSRDRDDVLWNNAGFLAFEVDDFNGFTFGGDVMFGVGRFVEVGAGANYYQRTVPSVYRDFVNVGGREIAQDLKLRIVPVTFTGRVFPFGREAPVQPYVGGGLALLNWKYSESGEFVDFANRREVFRDRFSDSGMELGGVGIFGVRFRVADAVFIGGEFRYQTGRADLDRSQGFAGDRLDLSGYTTFFTIQFGF